MSRRLTRRQLGALAGLGVLAGRRAAGAPSRPAPGRVAVVRPPVPAGGAPLPAESARRAVQAALAAATGASSARAAVAALFSPGDTVGIKLNCLAGPRLSPRPELVGALAQCLAEGGIAPRRIIVFERSSRELRRAGYRPGETGPEFVCRGIDNDYDSEIAVSGRIGSCYARLVSTTCTALIGFGVVKDHDLCGVSGSLKNWYGVIHNPNKYHDDNCDPYVADVANHPWVRGRLRLTLLDGLTAQCHGGPAYRPDAAFPLGVLAASTDPVAIDAWAWRVIDAERRRRGLPTLEQADRAPRFIATAAAYGLGAASPEEIVEVPA